MIEKLESGFFRQMPLKPGYAINVHKVQGLTLSNVHVDRDTGFFGHGQAYVALSRCKSMDGLTLQEPIPLGDFIYEPALVTFQQMCRLNSARASKLRNAK